MGSQRVGHYWSDLACLHAFHHDSIMHSIFSALKILCALPGTTWWSFWQNYGELLWLYPSGIFNSQTCPHCAISFEAAMSTETSAISYSSLHTTLLIPTTEKSFCSTQWHNLYLHPNILYILHPVLLISLRMKYYFTIL